MRLVRLRPVWMTNHPPSVLWHYWLGHQTCKTSSPKWPKLCQVGQLVSCVSWWSDVMCVCVCACVWMTGDSRLRSCRASCDWPALCVSAWVCSQVAAEWSSVQALFWPVQSGAGHPRKHWQDQEPMAQCRRSQRSPAPGFILMLISYTVSQTIYRSSLTIVSISVVLLWLVAG